MRKFFGVLAIVFAVIIPHELGHLAAARITGVGVLRFSVGFGPVIGSVWVGETEYCLSALPLGGYVMLADAEAAAQLSPEDRTELALRSPAALAMLSDKKRLLSYQSPAERFFIALSGAAVNFLFVLFSFPFLIRYASRGDIGIADLEQPETKGRALLGPISISKMAARAAERGLPAAWTLTARFSVGVGVLQLIPFPLLDGHQALGALMLTMLLPTGQTALSLVVMAFMAAVTFWLYQASVSRLVELRARLQLQPRSLWEVLRSLRIVG